MYFQCGILKYCPYRSSITKEFPRLKAFESLNYVGMFLQKLKAFESLNHVGMSMGSA